MLIGELRDIADIAVYGRFVSVEIDIFAAGLFI